MFSKKPVNRKVHRKKKKTASHNPDRNTLDSLRDREYQLNAQIGELEDILANHDRKAKEKETMRQDNILPPPERRSAHHSGHSNLRNSEKRRIHEEKNGGSLYFFILLIIAGLLAFWLFYTGG